jgi:hypothetical protein
MAEPLATIGELKARLEWELSEAEERLAIGALEELSEDARFYGKSSWVSAETTPNLVRNTLLKAAARFMRNPDAFTVSRAGDETTQWTDRGLDGGSANFTDREIKTLRTLAGTSNMMSAPISAWQSKDLDAVGFVPVNGSTEKPFPLFANNADSI